MDWLVYGLFVATIIELICCYLLSGLLQKVLASIATLIVVSDSALIFGLRPAVWTGLLVYFSAFRVINLLKLIDARKQRDFLRSSFFRSSVSLAIFQACILGLTYLTDVLGLSNVGAWTAVSIVCLFGNLVIALSLRRMFVKTRPKLNNQYIESSKLPSLTVAIPARNETADLEACLDCLVASSYPKLEILVLDDCSQEKRTPEIIRRYAQAGVIFLAGKQPNDSWAPKNYAYEQLSSEANGEVILFAGVDIRFNPETIKQMVELKIAKRKTMISFMPVNVLPKDRVKRLLIQPLRYLFELGLPRRTFNRPPVLSSCWLIDKSALEANGSFKAISRSIIPERYFARQSARQHDGYSFICQGLKLGLTSSKTFAEQLSTGTRTRYPLLKQRLEYVSLLALCELILFTLPIGLIIYGLVAVSGTLIAASLAAIVLSSLDLYLITKLTYHRKLYLSLILYPLVFIYDVCLVFYSMWRYEFSEVLWKGRNVCIPVMLVQSVNQAGSTLS